MADSIYDQAAGRLRASRRRRMKARTVGGAIAAAAAAGVVAVGAAAAFLSDHDSARNTLSIAANDIEIVEAFPDPPALVEEGEVEKVVQIRNTGTAACFVRVAIELTDDQAASYVELGIGSDAWTEKLADGFYYAAEPLEAGGITPPLLDGVFIGAEPDGGYGDFGIVVHAESAQATDPVTGAPYPDGPSAFAALAETRGGDHA